MSEELLVDYVRQALAEREAGRDVDVGELCRAHPELSRAVQEALQLEGTVDIDLDIDPLLGDVLNDRYEILECIGTGAMGTVYSASDRTLHREVAVKVLQPGILNGSDRQKRFVREAQVLASLEHPGIIAIFDHGRNPAGLSFLVMPRLIGVPMSGIILDAEDRSDGSDGVIALPASRHLTERFDVRCELDFIPQVATWFADLAVALRAAHGAGVFHRDIKPSNIFITRDGDAVLLDFGIAARVDDPTITAEGSTLGTPWYMSPEQADHRDTATPQVDVYGMCATMYHLLAMQPPFDGLSAEVIARLKKEDPPPLRSRCRSLPIDLCAIVEKGLERDPRHRYRDMGGLEADLRAFLAGRPVKARPISRGARLLRRARRRPMPLLVALLVVVTSAVAMLVSSYLRDEEFRQDELFKNSVAALPPSLAIEGSLKTRQNIPTRERMRLIDRLSLILELRPDDVNARLLRLALHQDEGANQASTADVRYLAGATPTSYLGGLLQRYERIQQGVKGVSALDLVGLPAPETDLDRVVAAFHLIRIKDESAAYDLLGKATDYLPARYMRINTFIGFALSVRGDERLEFVRWAREELRSLSEVLCETARIQYVLGSLALVMGTREAAMPPLRRAVELTDRQAYGPLYNLGHSLLLLGELNEAEAMMVEARDLRPWNGNAHLDLAQIKIAKGEFAAAMALAEALPESGDLLEPWYRAYLMGRVAESHSIYSIGAGREDEARELAAKTLEYLEASLERVPASQPRTRQKIRASIMLARLYSSEDPRYVEQFLGLMRSRPLDGYYLKTLVRLLGTRRLSARAQGLLRNVIHAQATARGNAPRSK